MSRANEAWEKWKFCRKCYRKGTFAPFYRPSWIEIDIGVIRSNIRALQRYICQVDGNVKLMAVVKGNAGGHGMIPIAKVAISAGCDWLGVATLDEAIVLRIKVSKAVPILVFGYVSPNHLNVVSELNITVTAISLEWIEAAAKVAEKPFSFHLKLDTGLNRFGCKTEQEVESVIEIVTRRSDVLKFDGAYTHFATAETVNDKTYFLKQLNRFEEFLKIIPNRHGKVIHCANSCATLFSAEKPFYDMVRCGRALWGPPNEKLKEHQAIPLRSSFSVRSTLIHVKRLEAGDKIGYSGTYTCQQREWIGTVPIGYADGWHQQFRMVEVLIDGKYIQVAGSILMDYIIVRLPKCYPVGTLVTLIGRCGKERITADDIAAIAGQPRSQVFANFSARIPRVYLDNGKIVGVTNQQLNQALNY